MAVKTITITEDAYESIKRLKRPDESFSVLFTRLSKRPLMIRDLVGSLKHTPEESAEFRKRVLSVRQKADQDMARRLDDARSRYKRAD